MSSALTLSACEVQISPYKHLPFGFGLGFRLGFEIGARDFLQFGLIVFRGLLPFLLGLEDAAEMLFGLLGDCLLSASQLNDVLSGLESLGDDLSEGLLMQICFLSQFHVVISDTLVQHTGYLFEDLAEVLLKLRGEAIE